MGSHIHRSIKEPLREAPSWDEKWRGPDKGLITAWEIGRRLAEREPDLSTRAKNGELPATGWKGGIERKLKNNKKYGTQKYLAEWQGLRCEDLDIDLSQEVTLTCSRTGMIVTFTDDTNKYCPQEDSLDFIALDVETANADMASICQIGIAKYSGGELIEEWVSLVNPETYFDYINTMLHGIAEEDVVDAPTFKEISTTLRSFLEDTVCISHTRFDRVSIDRALALNGLDKINTTWLDTARIARRTWEECAWSGYGLKKVCKMIGHKFKHHDALEDAKACGQVMLAAIDKTGLNIDSWLERVGQPIDPESSSQGSAIKRDGDPEGEFHGEVLVFTGELDVPRSVAADLAASAGCTVATSVTKKTTMLVVGDQDINKLADDEDKSNKHRKAEQLISKGQSIRILKESDFVELINTGWATHPPTPRS